MKPHYINNFAEVQRGSSHCLHKNKLTAQVKEIA